MITQKEVRELLVYIKETGQLVNRVHRGSNARKGDIVGSIGSKGYLKVRLLGKTRANHRMVFLYHNKSLPKFLDHIDGNKLNNRIENLRPCTISQNNFNKRIHKNNKSGVKGVCWCKSSNKWRANIQVNKKNFYLGLFNHIPKAEIAVKMKRLELHKGFANHGQ